MSNPALPEGQTDQSEPNNTNQRPEPPSKSATEAVQLPISNSPTSGAESSQINIASGSNDWDTPSLTNNDENLRFALDLLPQSLYGGVSAMSSRRPSYTAEFSSRPRLLDLPNPAPGTELDITNFPQKQLQQQLPQPQLFQQPFSVSGPSQNYSALSSNSSASKTNSMPLFDNDRWLRSGDPSRSIWFTSNPTENSPSGGGGTRPVSDLLGHTPAAVASTNFSPSSNPVNGPSSPVTGSLLLSPLANAAAVNANTTAPLNSVISPTGTHASLNDFALETAIGSQRNSRSVSFSHAYDRHQLSSPPKSKTLTSFYEDSVEEATDVLGSTHIDDSKHRNLRSRNSNQMLRNPITSLWFNDNISPAPATSNPTAAVVAAAAVAASSRRHSFATTFDSQFRQQLATQQQPSFTHVNESPVANTANIATKVSPPSSTIPEESNIDDGTQDATYTEVCRYFNNDKFGRNYGVLNGDSSNSISGATAASLITVPSSKLYLVQFKASRVEVFFVPEASNLSLRVNDLVIVDADRGRDLGKVIRIHVTAEEAGMLKWKQYQEQQTALQQTPGEPGDNSNNAGTASSGPSVMTPKQILRYAQPAEVQQILNKKSDEEKAIKTCTAKVQEKNLAMAVLDAEYQWDRRKLTFFYSASYRIDFRDLVRDLFRIYKTRIWMCAVYTGQPLSQQPQQVVQQYRSFPQGQQQDRSKMKEYMNGYSQELQQQQQHHFHQQQRNLPANSGIAYNGWQFSDSGMENRMMGLPSVSQQAHPAPYWTPIMVNPYGPSTPNPPPMSGPTVPGGPFY